MNELKRSVERLQVKNSCARRFWDDFKRDAVRLVVEKCAFVTVEAVGVSTKSLVHVPAGAVRRKRYR